MKLSLHLASLVLARRGQGLHFLKENLEASLDVRNLFDADVQDAGFGTAFPGDIPLPGRTVYFSLIGRF